MPVPTPTPSPGPAPVPAPTTSAAPPAGGPAGLAHGMVGGRPTAVSTGLATGVGRGVTGGPAAGAMLPDGAPDVSGLRNLAARLDAHASVVESCVGALGAALAQVRWRSAAGDLARSNFEARLADLRRDVAGLRDAGASVLRHAAAVEAAPPTPVERGLAGVAGSAPMPFRMR